MTPTVVVEEILDGVEIIDIIDGDKDAGEKAEEKSI